MVKEEDLKKMKPKRVFNLAVIGHVDHGKTTTTGAITQIWKDVLTRFGLQAKSVDEIDKCLEEKKRGVTINQKTIPVVLTIAKSSMSDEAFESEKLKNIQKYKDSYANSGSKSGVEDEKIEEENNSPIYKTASLEDVAAGTGDLYQMNLIDCPGHADYIKNMMVGTFQADAILLLVAANASVDLQTREHILLASKLGMKYAIIYVNKIDLIPAEDIEITKETILEEVYDLIAMNGMEIIAVRFGSSTKAFTGDTTYREILRSITKCVFNRIPAPKRKVDAPFQMYVDAVYQIQGRGTVISGLVESGTIKPGQTVSLVNPKDEIAKDVVITSVEEFKKQLTEALPGQNIGVLVRGLNAEDVHRGCLLAAAGTAKLYKKVLLKMAIIATDQGGRRTQICDGYRPTATKKTTQCAVTLTILHETRCAQPGETVDVVGVFDHKMPLEKGDNLVFRDGGVTVAAGIVVELSDDEKHVFSLEKQFATA